MCGICGFVGTVDGLVLRRMADGLRHRGPDDAGFYLGRTPPTATRRSGSGCAG